MYHPEKDGDTAAGDEPGRCLLGSGLVYGHFTAAVNVFSVYHRLCLIVKDDVTLLRPKTKVIYPVLWHSVRPQFSGPLMFKHKIKAE